MRLGIGSIHVGKKGGVRKVKQAICVICHAIASLAVVIGPFSVLPRALVLPPLAFAEEYVCSVRAAVSETGST